MNIHQPSVDVILRKSFPQHEPDFDPLITFLMGGMLSLCAQTAIHTTVTDR